VISQFTRIQNALINAAKSASFMVVAFDPNTGLANVTDVPAETTSIVVNEISGSFSDQNVRSRRIDMIDRNEWIWELRVEFRSGYQSNDDVFVKSVTIPKLKIPAGDGFRQVTLELRSSAYEHPPFGAPASGTKARYQFAATQTPY
jgi:hypothetical protein